MAEQKHIFGTDLFGNPMEAPRSRGPLGEMYEFPPFTVLNSRDSAWADRKRLWLAQGIQSEVGRQDQLVYNTNHMGKYGFDIGGTSVFDPVLCELMYRWFAPPGCQIVDPFAGGSVRGIVAGLLGYRYHGIELRGEQVAANREQAARICPEAAVTWVQGDSGVKLAEAPEADFLFSCPPYGNLEVYSDDEADISNRGYADFLEAYRDIIAKAVDRMKPNTFAGWVVGDYRDKKTGMFEGFVADTIVAFRDVGAPLYNDAILVTPVGTLAMRTSYFMSIGRKMGKAHQNVLVFMKGEGGRTGDFRKATRTITGAPEPPPKEARAQSAPRVQVVRQPLREPMPEGWQPDAIPTLNGVDEVALDFETRGLRHWEPEQGPVGVGVAWRRDGRLHSRYLPFGHCEGNLPEERVREFLLAEMRGKRVVNLNTKFDLHNWYTWLGVDPSEVFSSAGDIAHYAALLDDHRGEYATSQHRRPFSLEAIAQDYVGRGKVDLAMDQGAHVYPGWQVAPYGRTDVELILEVLEAMRPALAQEELGVVAALEDSVHWPVLEMERNGARLDVPALEAACRESLEDLEAMETQLHLLAGFRVNPDRADDLERLFKLRGLQSDRLTEKGRNSYAGDVLERAAQKDEAVGLLIKVGRLHDLRSKFLVPYLEAVGTGDILRFSFHQLRGDQYGTVSGRFSSSKPEGASSGANVQQVIGVKKHIRQYGDKYVVRRLFIPGAGNLLVSTDAKQIEYRVFAHLSRSARLIQAYRDNPEVDFHEWTGEAVRKFRPDFDRTQLKTANFRVLFGGGKNSTIEALGLTQAEGEELMGAYYRAFPEARATLKLASEVADSRGYIKTILGRRCRFPEKKRLYKALNGAVQGSAADLNKRKAVELWEARKRLGLTLRMTVHDEFVMDAPDLAAAQGVLQLLDAQTTPLDVPILWSLKTGANWGDAK